MRFAALIGILRSLWLDGVYEQTTDATDGELQFHEAAGSTREQLTTLIDKIIHRIVKRVTRTGHLIEEQGEVYLANTWTTHSRRCKRPRPPGALHTARAPGKRCCACGGKLEFIAVIEQPDVIEKILKHLGLDPRPPPISPARREELGELFEAV